MMELPEPLTAASAQGEDRSSYQAVGSWSSDAFGFAKATEADTYVDPTFARNWANLKAEGKVRGAYHFFHPSDPASVQAALFVKTVKAQGLEPGDILVVDSEITSGVDGQFRLSTPQAATRSAVPIAQPFLDATSALVDTTTLAFCEQVAAAVGPHNPVLIYTNESVAHQLTSCAHFGLWIAYPSSVAPTAISPWTTWKFWQWAYGGGQGGGDRDAYNGTPAQLKAWIDTYLPAPDPPAPPVPSLGDDMPAGKILVGAPPECVVIPSGAKTLTLYCDHVTAALHASVRVAILHGGVYAITAAEIVSADKVYTVTLPAGASAVSLAREDTNTSLAPGYYVG
jgi:GH25 family lysozyme M1 (1,4-beta-N-acetylmuramidase)